MKKLKALTFCLLLSACTQALFAQQQGQAVLDQHTRSAVQDSVIHYLDRYYVLKDPAKMAIFYLRKQVQHRAYDTITNPSRLAIAITNDLRKVLHDKHLFIRYSPALEKRVLAAGKNQHMNNAAVAQDAKENFAFKHLEILPGNLGFMEFTSFDDNSDEARKTVQAAMQFVSHTNALIIDLRSNYGGNGPMVGEILSYFFKEHTLAGRAFNSVADKWEDIYYDNNPAITQGLYLGMPLYVLVSNKTISAAEAFAYTLQTIKKAPVFGEMTVGSVHLTRTFALGNGFLGFIPISRTENIVTKTDVEGKGIIPDVPVRQDSALGKAEEQILSHMLDTIKGKQDKQRIIWAINAIRAKEHPVSVSSELLAKYTGDFDGIFIKKVSDQLVYTNTHDNNKTDILKPITDNLFYVDFHGQVEFVKDTIGDITAIKLYWDDGWIDTLKKIGK